MDSSERLEDFLTPAPGIQCEDPRIFELAKNTARGAAGDVEAARKLFVFARDAVKYNPFVPYDRMEYYLALNTLERGKGYCVQKAALLAAMARAIGIPARLGFADIANHQLPAGMNQMLGRNVMYHHCFVEWWVGGKWLKATPSFEEPLCRERGWRLSEFTGTEDAVLPETDLAGNPHISYLRYHGHRVGVPLDEILASWLEHYGEARLKVWQAALDSARDQGKVSR